MMIRRVEDMNYTDFMKEVELTKKKNPFLFKLEHDDVASELDINESEKYYGISFSESYKSVLMNLGGGYFGYIVLYSLDKSGLFYLQDYVSISMIEEFGMLPVIDLETGDYIGFDIENNKCTENLVTWIHEEKNKAKIDFDFYELLINMGLKNQLL